MALIAMVGVNNVCILSYNCNTYALDVAANVAYKEGIVGTYLPYTSILRRSNNLFSLIITHSINKVDIFKFKFEHSDEKREASVTENSKVLPSAGEIEYKTKNTTSHNANINVDLRKPSLQQSQQLVANSIAANLSVQRNSEAGFSYFTSVSGSPKRYYQKSLSPAVMSGGGLAIRKTLIDGNEPQSPGGRLRQVAIEKQPQELKLDKPSIVPLRKPSSHEPHSPATVMPVIESVAKLARQRSRSLSHEHTEKPIEPVFLNSGNNTETQRSAPKDKLFQITVNSSSQIFRNTPDFNQILKESPLGNRGSDQDRSSNENASNKDGRPVHKVSGFHAKRKMSKLMEHRKSFTQFQGCEELFMAPSNNFVISSKKLADHQEDLPESKHSDSARSGKSSNANPQLAKQLDLIQAKEVKNDSHRRESIKAESIRIESSGKLDHQNVTSAHNRLEQVTQELKESKQQKERVRSISVGCFF